MKRLRRVQFGSTILREPAQKLTVDYIVKGDISRLIEDMFYTLEHCKLGVGLAAPQVGRSVAVAVIRAYPTIQRIKAKPLSIAMINPIIITAHGNKTPMWEGCISCGSSGSPGLFAKVPRYKKVTVSYLDQAGKKHKKTFEGLMAQIAQHEIDHLHGILFVDRVKDPRTFCTYSEYKKQLKLKS